MNYVIDADIFIYFLNKNQKVEGKFAQIKDENLFTTIFNYSELFFGAYYSSKKEENLIKMKRALDNINLLHFDKKAAVKFAQLKAGLKRSGNLIADVDLMIASICLVHNFVLVTNNIKHFNRVESLSIENWV